MGRFCPFRCRCLLLKLNAMCHFFSFLVNFLSLLAIYRNTPSFAPLPSEVNDKNWQLSSLPGVVGQHQEQAQLLPRPSILQPHPHLPRRHLLNTRSTKSQIVRILAKMFQRASSRGCRGCWVGREAGTVEPPPSSPLSSCSSSWYVLVVQLCSSQAQFHQVLVPLTVKFTTVFYGHPTRCFSHSAYQVQPLQLVVKARIRFSAGAALLMADRLLSHLPHHHQQRRQPFRPLEGVNLSSSKEDSEMSPSLKSSNHLRTSDFDTCALCRRLLKREHWTCG